MTAVLDDQCLSLVLRGRDIDEFNDTDLYTTGLWYFRLCQAYFRSVTSGVLSRPFEGLSGRERLAAEQRLLELPSSISLLSLRDLVPIMGQQIEFHPTLNLLAREALAAATFLGADVYLTTSSPQLETALAHEGLTVVIVEMDTPTA